MLGDENEVPLIAGFIYISIFILPSSLEEAIVILGSSFWMRFGEALKSSEFDSRAFNNIVGCFLGGSVRLVILIGSLLNFKEVPLSFLEFE